MCSNTYINSKKKKLFKSTKLRLWFLRFFFQIPNFFNDVAPFNLMSNVE